MRRRDLTEAVLPDGSAFRTEWIEIGRGIRVGHLRPEERFTRIVKFRLHRRYGRDFLVDRWGRGSIWPTVWFVPRENRRAKSAAGRGHFSCAKFYAAAPPGEEVFRAGFHIESGLRRSPDRPELERKNDWDWHRFLRALRRNDAFDEHLRRLVRRDGFSVSVGFFDRRTFPADSFEGSRTILRAIRKQDPDGWTGVLIDYGWNAGEIASMNGPELIDAVMAVYDELYDIMNACLQIPIARK